MTSNKKSPLGLILLICLISLAGVLFYVVQSPDLEIASHPSRHDPAFLADKTKIGVFVAGFAVVIWGLLKLSRK